MDRIARLNRTECPKDRPFAPLLFERLQVDFPAASTKSVATQWGLKIPGIYTLAGAGQSVCACNAGFYFSLCRCAGSLTSSCGLMPVPVTIEAGLLKYCECCCCCCCVCVCVCACVCVCVRASEHLSRLQGFFKGQVTNCTGTMSW